MIPNVQSTFRLVAIVAAISTLAACAAFERPVPFDTFAGPESPGMVAGMHGLFVVGDGMSTCYPLRTIDPSEPQHCIPRLGDLRPDGTPGGWDSAVLPLRRDAVLRLRMTAAGRTAEDARLPVRVALESVSYCRRGERSCKDGGETLATWTRPPGMNLYHETLALSPDGRRAAIVPESRLLRVRDARFGGQHLVGPLKIVDLQTGTIDDAGIDVLDEQPVSWSSDGRRLLLVRAEPVEHLPVRLASEFDASAAGQDVPVVETFDVATRTLTMLAVGRQPLWSPDDRTLLYQPSSDRVETMDLGDFTRRAANLPGMSTRYQPIAIAFVSARRVLYWALPTAGAAPGFTINNSPLVGPKQMVSLKVADLDTGAFATVYPSLDPRSRVGYRAE